MHFRRISFVVLYSPGSLEWVGRSLAEQVVSGFGLRRMPSERKVRTPQGSGLANGQTGRPDDKCNREQTSRWLVGDRGNADAVEHR